jgi:hypothetical protein
LVLLAGLCALPVFWRLKNLFSGVVGPAAVASGLAGVEGGPVQAVWYSADAARLFVRTESVGSFESADFETWKLNQSEPLPDLSVARGPRLQSALVPGRFIREPKSCTSRWMAASRGGSMLTGFDDESVVGGGADSLAVHPRNFAGFGDREFAQGFGGRSTAG